MQYDRVEQWEARQQKIETGALLPVVYAKTNPKAVKRVHFPEERCAISFVSNTIVPKPTLVFQDNFKQIDRGVRKRYNNNEMEMWSPQL